MHIAFICVLSFFAVFGIAFFVSTIELRRLFFWRRIAALEARTEQLSTGLQKSLATNENLEKMLKALLIAEPPKKAVLKLRNQAEANAFIGENFDAPS